MRLYLAGHDWATGADPVMQLRAAGHDVRVPAATATSTVTAGARPGDTEEMALSRARMRMLTDCDAIALTPGWRDDADALAAVDWADTVGLPVEDWEAWI